MQQILAKASQIKVIIFDVDGVLTDGRLFVTDEGVEFKAFYARDGLGMRMLQNSGVQVGVISGRTSGALLHRCKELGIELIYQGQRNKLPAFEQLLQETQLSEHQIAYVGDDVIDIAVMLRVGLAVAVADAHRDVCQVAHWQTPNEGGRGAVRDVCELIMNAQGTLAAQLEMMSIQ